MKLIRFVAGSGVPRHGILEGATVRPLAADPYADPSLRQTGETLPLGSVRLLAPVQPSNIITALMEWNDKATPPRQEILLITKPRSAVAAPGEAIRLPREGKAFGAIPGLALVIGKPCRNLSKAEAAAAILGYTCFDNVCAVDIFERNKSWVNASAFDSFAPFGPVVETEFKFAGAGMRYRIDGKVVEETRLDPSAFDPVAIVAFVSQVTTLLPGDVITSGRRTNFNPIAAGQQVEVEIDGIGTLANPVAARTYSR